MTQQTDRTTDEIRGMVDEWVAAELGGDVAALDRLAVDDFLAIGPLGFVLTREQWLARYATGDLHLDTLALEDARVRAYGDAAIVTGRYVQTGTYRAHAVPPGGRATLIWVRQGGRWRLAGWQLSPIQQGG